MAIYVDDMHETALGKYGRMKMCHMIADTVEELHEMADKVGIARKWDQGPPITTRPHYDICLTKRAEAMKQGAQEITLRERALKMRSLSTATARKGRRLTLPVTFAIMEMALFGPL